METVDRIILGQKRKFDALRRKFTRAGVRCFLLAQDKFQESSFYVIEELTEGYLFKFSEYFNSFRLKRATTDETFLAVSDTVTHIAYDGDVYLIPPSNRVVIKPNGTKPYYQFFCVQTDPLEKFQAPD